MAKIVIAEDEKEVAELVKLRLGEAGHQVSIAADGAIAPHVVARDGPQLVILDFNMPHANGAAVYKTLRHNDSTCATPVIFLTSAPLVDVMTQVADDLKTRFLEKPIDFPFLLRTVDDLLTER